MRRITTWLLSTLSALVLLFSYHTSTNSGSATAVATGSADAAANGSTDPGSSGSGSSGSGTDPGSAATPAPTPSADAGSSGSSGSSGSGSSAGSSSSGTFTGDAVQTRYGPVQVEITVKDGTITKSVVTQVPWNDHKDQEINSYAVPILNDETVQAQSAGIDMVSGATFTSDGYVQSLQSAIDRAHL